MTAALSGEGVAEERLTELRRRGRELEAAGLPFPTRTVETSVSTLLAEGHEPEALELLARNEALLAVAGRDWQWVQQSLARADELRELATSAGLDVAILDARMGNPRAQFLRTPLSAASLSRAAADAARAVAVLSDAIPKYCVKEAQRLGQTIRAARNRGEDVAEVVRRFSQLLSAIQDQHPVAMTRALISVRHAVARIPRAPSIPAAPSDEEEEILTEARNLARRLQQIKGRARNAQSAARLMTQVRAALSEDRRYGTPEEEIEALWNEVDRLTRERQARGATRLAGADPRAPVALVQGEAAETPPPERGTGPPSSQEHDSGEEPANLVGSSTERGRERGPGRP